MPIKLIIADDQQIIRQGLLAVFDDERFHIIGQASNGRQLVEQAKALKPDLVIADYSMPVFNGLEACSAIKEVDKNIKVMIMLDEFDILDKGLISDSGADACVTKDILPDELISIAQLVYTGRYCIFPDFIRCIIKANDGNDNIGKSINLTQREMEVYKLVARSYTNQEIAKKLYISEATVKSHVSQILKKTGQNNRVQAVLYGFSKGIFSPYSI